jgi:signal transduction histidine kinase
MTSLKQFTGWAIGSNRIPNQIFNDIHGRLMLAYLVAMTAIVGVSETTFYFFFSRSLNSQLNNQLLTLVQAAAPSLRTVRVEGRPSLDEELPWRNLFSTREQSLEWFDPNGKLLAQEGEDFPQLPLAQNLSFSQLSKGSPVIQHQEQMRVITIGVYANTSDAKTLRLEGYLRASQSTKRLESTLSNLRLGMGLGGIIALLLASVSSLYLTRQVVKPMRYNFQRLTQFAADASHELRNPLLRISIATEIMLSHEERLEPADIKKLTTISTATEQMKRLIDDVLFLARTDAAYIPLTDQERTVALDTLLKTLVERFEPQAQVKGIHFQKQVPDDLAVMGNANQLERLFSNLLENALKYTEKGGRVTVSVNKYRQNAIISVKDTGMGIPPEYLPFIFQRFCRAEQARAKEEDGFGLGLAIAQTIAKQHGGEITVNSQLGFGTCFQVRLPLA